MCADPLLSEYGWVIALACHRGGWAPMLDTVALSRRQAIERYEAAGWGIYTEQRQAGHVRTLRCTVAMQWPRGAPQPTEGGV